jgi:N-acetylneuraminic acid mutarotase
MSLRSKIFIFLAGLSLSCADPAQQPVIHTGPGTSTEFVTPCPGQFFCFDSHNFGSVYYTSPNAFPAAFGASASLGDNVFFAGGHEEGSIGFVMPDVNIFNNTTNQWFHSLLSVPRSHLTGASAGDKVLFAGGTNIASMIPVYGSVPLEYYDVVDIYHGESLASDIGFLSEKRGYMASVSTGTKAYFIGGKTLEGYSSKMDVYDAELNSWTVVEMPRVRGYSSAVVVSDKIYVCGGQNSDGNLTVTDVYDIGTGQWSSIQTPHERPIATAVALGDRIFLAGGDGESNNAVDIFNTVDGTWSSTGLSDSRSYIAGASATNKIIFFGGALSRNIDVYDELSDSWTLAKLSEGVTGVAAASALDQCFFMAFLYEKGYSLTNSMIAIRP